MRASIYVRPWSIQYYRYLGARLFPSYGVSFVSDHRLGGVNSLAEDFYFYYRAMTAKHRDL